MSNRPAIEPNNFVRNLAAAMKARDLPWEKSQPWTDALKEIICKLLERSDVQIHCSDPSRNRHEFLLDLVVWDKAGKGLILAVESEWTQTVESIVEDFRKLLVVKAPLKLMVFACNPRPTKFSETAVRDALKQCIEGYQDHCKGEQYIFMNFAQGADRKAWWLEMSEPSKNGETPAFIDKGEIALG